MHGEGGGLCMVSVEGYYGGVIITIWHSFNRLSTRL